MQLNKEVVKQAHTIKNIIFDWGGVISNIDYNKSIEGFRRLGFDGFDSFYTQRNQTMLFDRLEKGTIPPAEFRDEIRKITGLSLTDEEIDSAWTAMLLDLPVERLALLEKVKEHYPIFLLSNTNQIHVSRYSKYLDQIYGHKKFRDLFIRAYYSHDLGMRKPDAEIFEHVLTSHNLKADETLFIDDTAQHIEGAKRTGIITHHLQKPLTILNLFSHDKN